MSDLGISLSSLWLKYHGICISDPFSILLTAPAQTITYALYQSQPIWGIFISSFLVYLKLLCCIWVLDPKNLIRYGYAA